MRTSKPSSVELRGVSKSYGPGPPAVDGIDLLIGSGKLVTLLGPSGCGKTTTLRMIAGLETVSGGKILLDGQDVTALSATDRDISMVFQSYALFPHMNVRDNVAFGLRMSGHKQPAARTMADEGLERVGLTGMGDRLPSELSGGQQQRVAVARALVLEPKVLLFDEPLSNLDARLRRRVRGDIRELQRTSGLTVVYVTHDQEEALAVSDETVVMSEGSIAQVGTPRELYERPANRFVADFIGEANLIGCEVRSVDNGTASVALGPMTISLGVDGGKPLEKGLVAVRPNQVSVHPGRERGNALPGKLLSVTYVGHKLEIMIETELGEIFATSDDTRKTLSDGQEVSVTFSDHGPVLIADDWDAA